VIAHLSPRRLKPALYDFDSAPATRACGAGRGRPTSLRTSSSFCSTEADHSVVYRTRQASYLRICPARRS